MRAEGRGGTGSPWLGDSPNTERKVLELPSSPCGDGFGSLSSTSSRSACFAVLAVSVPPRTRSSAGAMPPPRDYAEPSLRAAESVVFGETDSRLRSSNSCSRSCVITDRHIGTVRGLGIAHPLTGDRIRERHLRQGAARSPAARPASAPTSQSARPAFG